MNGIPTPPSEPSAPSRVRWRIVALLMAYVAVCHFNRISMSAAGAEHIMPDYHIDATTMGFVYSSYLFLYTLCMIPGGWFIDRFGARIALIEVGFASAVFVALTGLMGMALSTGGFLVAGLLVVRGLLGVVTAPIHPGCARAVGVWMPSASQATANGLVIGASSLGVASTFFVFGELSDWLGWSGAFVVSGVATALLAVLWTSYAASHPSQHPAVNDAERNLIEWDRRQAERAHAPLAVEEKPALALGASARRSLILLTFSYGTINYMEYLFYYWSQYYFETVQKLGKETGRLYSTLLTLAMGAGIMIGGWLADRAIVRFGRRRGMAVVPMAGMVVCALGVVLALLSSTPLLALVFFIVAMAAVGACEGPFWACVIGIGGRRAGQAGGILNAGGNAGGLLAPIVTPFFSEVFGWKAGLALAALICLLGAIPWFWIDSTAKPRDHTES